MIAKGINKNKTNVEALKNELATNFGYYSNSTFTIIDEETLKSKFLMKLTCFLK